MKGQLTLPLTDAIYAASTPPPSRLSAADTKADTGHISAAAGCHYADEDARAADANTPPRLRCQIVSYYAEMMPLLT